MQFLYVTAGGNRVTNVFRGYYCTLRLYKEGSSFFSLLFFLPRLLPLLFLFLSLFFLFYFSSSFFFPLLFFLFFFLHHNSTLFLVVCTRSFQAFLSLMSWAQFLSFGVPFISFGVFFGRLQYPPDFTSVELLTLIFTRLGR